MLRFLAVVLFASVSFGAAGATLKPQTINDAKFQGHGSAKHKAVDPVAIKAQVLLDRAHFSPGEIDGKRGDNFTKALRAFASANSLAPGKDALTADVFAKLVATGGAPVIMSYQIADGDLKGPFLHKLPRKMEAMKSLRHLGYTSLREALAEKFHMSPALLTSLNPGAHFDEAGSTINVAAVARSGDAAATPPQAARIEVDKGSQVLKAFDEAGNLIDFAPVTVGSEEKPAPSGMLKVVSVDRNPTYRYNPDYHFKGIKTHRPFRIKPGPNNPVGLVWIGLSEQGYGIHGTPEPSKVGKTASHGCIRLTNWDALTLAAMAKKGIDVTFVDGSSNDGSSNDEKAQAK